MREDGIFYCLDDDRVPYLLERKANKFFKRLESTLELFRDHWNGLSPDELAEDPLIVRSLYLCYGNSGNYFETDDIIRITSASPF